MPQATPTMIQALIDSGELTQDDIRNIPDPQDAKLAASLLIKSGKVDVMGSGDMGIGIGPPSLGAVGEAVGGLVNKLPSNMLKKGWNAISAPFGMAAGGAAGSAMGHPYAGAGAGYQLGKKMKFTIPEEPMPAPKSPEAPPPFQRTALHPADGMIDDEITERVTQGGVQHDFKPGKAVTLRPPPEQPYGGGLSRVPQGEMPPNLKASRSIDDVREQVTGSSRIGWEDPRHGVSIDQPDDDVVARVQKEIAAILDKKKPPTRRQPK